MQLIYSWCAVHPQVTMQSPLPLQLLMQERQSSATLLLQPE